ncbi:hypothetical protein [Haladaptatus halobius]|uniref:hypothetical protein n=1 Tax=Haladaptatus halobius TaxID=2884875 RepID=UPI001D0BC50C|nr:hypothetical protein [Haladaptatus halobius]
MQVTIDANGVEELIYEMDIPPRKNEIVRLKGDVYNVVEVIWRETADGSGLEPVVELHRSSL